MFYTKGGMNLDKLETMPFDEFLMFVKEAKRIEKIMNTSEVPDG